MSRKDCARGISLVGGVITLFSNAASRASTLVEEVGVMPVTSRLPPLPPKADVKLGVFTIPCPCGGAAVRSFVHFDTPGCVGIAGGIGRIELVRLGGDPGIADVGVVLERAESSQVDFVGDQRFRERESLERESGRR